jgi:hypothetical protein
LIFRRDRNYPALSGVGADGRVVVATKDLWFLAG